MFHCTLSKYICSLACSVVDPNTLVLYPDPNSGFWPNLDPDLVFYYQFWKKKLKIILAKKCPLKKDIFLTTIWTKCHLKKFLLSWVSELWYYILNLTPFYLHFILHLLVCNCAYTDLDPEVSWIWIMFGSGSTTLLACCANSIYFIGCFVKSICFLACCAKSIYSLACCDKSIKIHSLLCKIYILRNIYILYRYTLFIQRQMFILQSDEFYK